MKGKTKKIMAVICLILTMITALPIQAFATFITDINSNAEFGVIGGSLSTFGHELHYANYDGGTYIMNETLRKFMDRLDIVVSEKDNLIE